MIFIYTNLPRRPRMTHSDSREGVLRKYNTPALQVRTPKKTCLKDLSRATSRRSWTTERQLALALTPYAQVTDLAVNTAASGNNAAAIQSLDDRVTAELASKLDSSALAPAIAPLPTAAALATTDGQVAAHGSSIAALQSSLTTGLSNKADQSAFDVLEGVVATKSTPDGVDLKLSNYSTTAAMNGSIASANNATLATAAANYGLKTVVDQHSLDIAARITPLEVDTKVANALLGAVTAAALASELASRDASISGLQASKADASALTAEGPTTSRWPPWVRWKAEALICMLYRSSVPADCCTSPEIEPPKAPKCSFATPPGGAEKSRRAVLQTPCAAVPRKVPVTPT